MFRYGISVSCVDVVGNIADKSKEQQNYDEIKQVINIASDLNCEFIRLHAYNAVYEEIDNYFNSLNKE